jgi:hypothetical protein
MFSPDVQPIDARLALLARASARLTLLEAGEIDPDEAIELFDMDPTFWRACARADAKAAKAKRDPKTERLRRLLDDDVSLERAYAELNPHPTPKPNGPATCHVALPDPSAKRLPTEIISALVTDACAAADAPNKRLCAIWKAIVAPANADDRTIIAKQIAERLTRAGYAAFDRYGHNSPEAKQDFDHVVTWAIRGRYPF